jgi:AAA domain, putative AbiEii toxin, Type IV TA system/AAA domain
MIIKKAEIAKFRGFKNVHFELGSQVTVIAGQNGTQKTTILGLLTQPFTITDSANPMKGVKPLSGGSFKSGFSEKFKLSPTFDLPKSHEWTLYVEGEDPMVVESIKRNSSGEIRFWRKGSRAQGSGYIQLPVIFLSLKRLIPIGEDVKLTVSTLETLTPEEITFFKKWHRKILLSLEEIQETQYLESPDKNTLGINTATYDWQLNSAGQDNVGKILLAVMSFMRLQSEYPDHYKGGILAIDEMDATLYPASQVELFNAMRAFASKHKIQFIFSTHSLSLLDRACGLQLENANNAQTSHQVKVIYLEKFNGYIRVIESILFKSVVHRLNVTMDAAKPVRINAFSEDRECRIFVNALLKSKASKLNFIDCTMGGSALTELGLKKIPSFSIPEGMVFLDGDIRTSPALLKKVKQLPNFIVLPGSIRPESLLANFLHELPDDSPVWSSINEHFTRQYCFREISLAEVQSDRTKAKVWFNSHLESWGRSAVKVINPWMQTNKQLVDTFISEFAISYNMFAEQLSLTPLPVS